MAIGGDGDSQQETRSRNESESLNPPGGVKEGFANRGGGGGASKPEGKVPLTHSPKHTASFSSGQAASPYYVRTEEHDTETEEDSTETEGTPSPEQGARGPSSIDMEEGLTETTERVAASQKERIFYSMLAAVEAAETVRTTGNVAFTAGSYQNALTLYSVALRHLEEARKLQTGDAAEIHRTRGMGDRPVDSVAPCSRCLEESYDAASAAWRKIKCSRFPREFLPLHPVPPFSHLPLPSKAPFQTANTTKKLLSACRRSRRGGVCHGRERQQDVELHAGMPPQQRHVLSQAREVAGLRRLVQHYLAGWCRLPCPASDSCASQFIFHPGWQCTSRPSTKTRRVHLSTGSDVHASMNSTFNGDCK